MENKEKLLLLIEGLNAELKQKTDKLSELANQDFAVAVQEESNRLIAETNEKLEAFKIQLDTDKTAIVDNINLDICAINRIIADKTNLLAELEAKELAEAEAAKIQEATTADPVL